MTMNDLILFLALGLFAGLAVVGVILTIRAIRAPRPPYVPLEREPKHRRF